MKKQEEERFSEALERAKKAVLVADAWKILSEAVQSLLDDSNKARRDAR